MPSPPNQMNRILVIDDDPSFARILAWELEDTGFIVNIACSCPSAHRAVTQAHYDIALLDYHLPDCTCFDIMPELVAYSPNVEILVMSGDSDRTLPEQAICKGATAFLRKPIKTAELRAVLRRYQTLH